MKNSIVACLVLLSVVAFASARPAEDGSYGHEYDNFDVDEVLQSDRLLNNYLTCAKTGKRCTPEGQRLRETLPDALKTRCAKCTEAQRKQGNKVIKFLIKNKYPQFREIEDQYDPEHKYRSDFAEELKKEGIELPPL